MKKNRVTLLLLIFIVVWMAVEIPAPAQSARMRWEMKNQIRQDKFDLILPEVMRENNIDMWITMMKEGNYGPLYEDFGRGYISDKGFYIFTDRGGHRIERAALGVNGYMIQKSGAYDIFGSADDLKKFVRERDPKRIGINISETIGSADSLTHTGYLYLKKTLGEPYAGRLVSAEKLVSDFRSRRVASEIVAFGRAGMISKEIAERALSNEVIVPGKTQLQEVAWWILEELQRRHLGTSFDMPSIYITGRKGIEAVSNERIIRRGDVIMIDWGIGLMNFYTDMKRTAYVLREGEKGLPKGIKNAFDRAVKVRDTIRRNIKPGKTAGETLNMLNQKIAEMKGFSVMKKFNQPYNTPTTDVIVGCHSVGNWGHGIGPSIATFNPVRMNFEIRPTNMFVIEFFAYTPVPEWGGAKLRVPLEDDAIVMENGVNWLYPVQDRILLIR